MCIFCAEQYVSTSYSLPTAAILNEISPPTLHSDTLSVKTGKETEIRNYIKFRAEDLLLKHSSPHIQ